MTVTTTISSKDFVTNGVTTVFPFSIQFFSDTDLQVTKIDPAGAETLLTLGTHYTVQGAGSPSGGSITTLGTPLPAGTLLVERVLVAQQQTDLRNQGSNFAENHERVFDRLTMLIQQVITGLGNTLQLTKDKLRWDFKGRRGVNVGAPVDASDVATKGYADTGDAAVIAHANNLHSLTVRAPEAISALPPAASRANKVMGFDASGNPIGVLPASGSGTELAIDLANGVDPAKGAGMVGWSQQAAGAVSISIGNRLRLQSVDIRDFGASSAASDNRAALQAAIDFAAAQGRPLNGDGGFDILGPLYLPSNLNWEGNVHIRNTSNDANTQRRLCIYPGTYNPVYLDSLTYHLLNSNGAGERSVTCTTVAQAGNYAVGEIVLVRSLSKYNGATGPIPIYASLNRVQSADAGTGVIRLEFPVGAAMSDGEIAKVNGTGILDILGEREIFCAYNIRLRGVSFESVNGHIMERGGMLACDMQIPRMAGLSGIYTNLVCHSSIKVGHILCDLRAVEMGGNSSHTRVHVNTVAYQKTARSSAQPIVSINENQRDCQLSFDTFGCGSHDYVAQPLFSVLSARDNRISVEKLLANNAAGSLVTFENLLKNAAGETQPETSDNSFHVGRAVTAGGLQRNGFWVNSGGQNKRNRLGGQYATGPTVTAISLAGDGHVVDAGFDAGSVSLGSSTNCTVDYRGPGSVIGLVRTSGNDVVQNGQYLVEQPLITSHQVVVNAVANGGGGAIVLSPDMTNGSYQIFRFTSATSVSVNNPTGGVGGDVFVMQLENQNGATAITPTFGSAFAFGGEVPPSLPAGKKAIYEFIVTPDFAYVLRRGINNNF